MPRRRRFRRSAHLPNTKPRDAVRRDASRSDLTGPLDLPDLFDRLDLPDLFDLLDPVSVSP